MSSTAELTENDIPMNALIAVVGPSKAERHFVGEEVLFTIGQRHSHWMALASHSSMPFDEQGIIHGYIHEEDSVLNDETLHAFLERLQKTASTANSAGFFFCDRDAAEWQRTLTSDLCSRVATFASIDEIPPAVRAAVQVWVFAKDADGNLPKKEIRTFCESMECADCWPEIEQFLAHHGTAYAFRVDRESETIEGFLCRFTRFPRQKFIGSRAYRESKKFFV